MEIIRAFKNDRLMRGLTGLSIKEFKEIEPVFGEVIYADRAGRKRARSVGGGQKGALVDKQQKLFFILLYLKIYPTCDFGGFIFNVDRSRICKWNKQLMPLLEKALGRSVQLPKRSISSMEELLKLVPEAKDLFIDGTERETQRPKKGKLKRKRYYGKKKIHSRKNTVVCDENKKIILVTPTK